MGSRTIIAVLASSGVWTAACRRDTPARERAPAAAAGPGAPAGDTGAGAGDTVEIAGEVTADTGDRPVEQWLSDPNVLSLLSVMNARQIAAAQIELGAWHFVTVRDFAASVLHDHAVLQRSIDSVSQVLHMAPVRPALADVVTAAFQAQIDTMLAQARGPRGSLDRAFVAQQIAGHALMATYVADLTAVAERPELQQFLTAAAATVSSGLARARAMQARLAAMDTLAADSAARRDSMGGNRDSLRP